MTATPVLAAAAHAEELHRLQKILRCYPGFQLILALYNDPPDYRDRLIALLNQPFAHPALLDTRSLADFSAFEHRLTDSAVEADIIHVVGLDAWLLDEYREQRLQSFNQRRESIAHCCAKPLLLWLPGYLARDFALQAPDCWEWRRAVIDFCYLPEPPLEKADFSFKTTQLLKQQLSRLPPLDYQRAEALAVFYDELTLEVLATLMDWPLESVQSLAASLVAVDLATDQGAEHFSLEPGLCAYFRLAMDAQTLVERQGRWRQVMIEFINNLTHQQAQDPERIASLTNLEWPNFSALLEQWPQLGTSDAVIELCANLYFLLRFSGKPEQLTRIAQVRDLAEQDLSPAWSHARFLVQLNRVQNLLASGQLQTVHHHAENLLALTLQAGATAYQGADYDLALAYFMLGNALSTGGLAEAALAPLQQAQLAFQQLADNGDQNAAKMVSATLTGLGDCLRDTGQPDKAAEIYHLAIKLSEQLADKRGVAVKKGQLATVLMLQQDYQAALAAYAEARDSFQQLNEPSSVAVAWHQTGIVYRQMQAYEQADQAYRQALAIESQLGNQAGVASSLAELGNLYDAWGKLEPALVFYRQANDIYGQLGDKRYEGVIRNNIAYSLIKLQRYDEARGELQQAIACNKAFGHSVEPWKTWDILHNLEQACANPSAALAAKQQAIQCYLAYRREGGENMSGSQAPKLCQRVAQAIHDHSSEPLQQELLTQQNREDLPAYLKPLIPKLLAILAGQRSPSLADDPDLDYDDAAELLLLLLEQLA